jgi:hypothetical protein
MNRKQQKTLHTELKAAGASTTELPELTTLANNLSALRHTDVSVSPLAKQPRKRLRRAMTLSIPAVFGLAFGMFLVIASQTVLPGNPLYPVQEGSDAIAVAIDPGYRGTIMMRRAAQVKMLVSQHAPSERILATLADYQKQASSYKTTASNYAAFEYCKNNLQQASMQANGGVRQAINSTLASLASV